MENKKTKICHGCDGRGWVEVKDKAQVCPVCLGSGKKKLSNDIFDPPPPIRRKWESSQ